MHTKKVNRAKAKSEPLTPKQHGILGYISGHTIEYGYAPTMEEIAEVFGISIPTVQGHLSSLELKGHIKRIRNKARAIEVIDHGAAQSRAVEIAKLEYGIDLLNQIVEAWLCEDIPKVSLRQLVVLRKGLQVELDKLKKEAE